MRALGFEPLRAPCPTEVGQCERSKPAGEQVNQSISQCLCNKVGRPIQDLAGCLPWDGGKNRATGDWRHAEHSTAAECRQMSSRTAEPVALLWAVSQSVSQWQWQ
jgi:hypothetical protein